MAHSHQIKELGQDKRSKLIITPEQRYILKSKQDLNQLQRENLILEFLHKEGIPVNSPLRTQDHSQFTITENTPYCLYTFLEGTTIDLEIISENVSWCERFGIILGSLHSSLSLFPAPLLNFSDIPPLFEGLRERVLKFFQKASGRYNASRILPYLDLVESSFSSFEKVFSRQVIHRDFHLENLLFQGTHKNAQLIAILDFELVTYGIKIFDLCYLVSGVLSAIFDSHNTNFSASWYTILHSMVNGYLQTNIMNENEKKGFWSVLMQIQLFFLLYYHPVDISKAKRAEEIFYWIYEQKDQIERILLKSP